MFPVWYLDSPDVCTDNPDPTMFEVKGWIAAVDPARSISFKDKFVSQCLPVTTSRRSDVQKIYQLPAIGFEAGCRFDLVREREFLELEFTTDGQQYTIIVPVHAGRVDPGIQKSNKLERIRPYLICPECGATLSEEHLQALHCPVCAEHYPHNDKLYNFLTKQMRTRFDIVPTRNISAHGYDGVALNFIHKLRNGLILDCGAGLREKYYENVVNYEIVAYDSTDVLGVGEKLPFRNDTFDAVFSFAVLEHVRDPLLCAGELARVLKPGGSIYCQTAFLQPLHGYPHHYYNMTQKGMINIFDDLIRIERVDVLNFGQPIFALSWYLNSYIAGLPRNLKKKFREMKVKDLLQPGSDYLGSPFVTALSANVKEELACSNMILGTKPVKRK